MLHSLVAIALSILLTPLPPASVAPRSPAVAVGVGTMTERASVDEAVGRFVQAGLTLPEVDVTFSSDPADCSGHLGLFRPAFEPFRVVVCSDLAFVVTHELAHAWIEANLDAEQRERFVRDQRLAAWDGAGLAREDRGVEHGAFVIQQNLMAAAPDLDSDRWRDRMAAYELITSRPSPLRPSNVSPGQGDG